MARPKATTGKKDAVRDEGDKSMVSTLEDMMENRIKGGFFFFQAFSFTKAVIRGFGHYYKIFQTHLEKTTTCTKLKYQHRK